MLLHRKLILAAVSAAMLASAGAASAETRWDHHHPRQHEVLARDARLHHRIVVGRLDGRLSPAQSHRLLVKDRQIAREDHAVARANGGYITRGEQHQMNRQENRLSHHVAS